MDRLQMKFLKGENVKYISHLDLLRTFIRTFRRSGLPMRYSEGYNPRPKIAFALPLSLGITSEAELMEVQLSRDINLQEELKRLVAVLPEGIEIVEARVVNRKLPVITRAEYVITCTYDERSVMDKLQSSEILVEKKDKMINIVEHIHDFKLQDGGIFMSLSFNISPLLVLKALEIGENGVHRTNLI